MGRNPVGVQTDDIHSELYTIKSDNFNADYISFLPVLIYIFFFLPHKILVCSVSKCGIV